MTETLYKIMIIKLYYIKNWYIYILSKYTENLNNLN